jgi:hypothetical protein
VDTASDNIAFFKDKKKQMEATGGRVVDWNQKRQWWLDQLDLLYQNVVSWLKPLTDDQTAEIERQPVRINEEKIGEYEADALLITVAGDLCRLEPIGTLIIGAYGRVDLSGPANKVKLVLVGKGQRPKIIVQLWEGTGSRPKPPQEAEPMEWEWCLVASGPTGPDYPPLDQNVFLEALRQVVER